MDTLDRDEAHSGGRRESYVTRDHCVHVEQCDHDTFNENGGDL
jgi:hypothetical protein